MMIFLRSPLFSFLWLHNFSVLPPWPSFLARRPPSTTETLVFPGLTCHVLLVCSHDLSLHLQAKDSHTSDPCPDIIPGFPDPQKPPSSIISWILSPLRWAGPEDSYFHFIGKKTAETQIQRAGLKSHSVAATWQDQDSTPCLVCRAVGLQTWHGTFTLPGPGTELLFRPGMLHLGMAVPSGKMEGSPHLFPSLLYS